MKNLFLLPTKNESKLAIKSGSLKLRLGETFTNGVRDAENQNIYVVSDELINNCWVLNTVSGTVFFVDRKEEIVLPVSKKIILTSDLKLQDNVQIVDNEFLKWFVKNSSCEFVETEIVHKFCDMPNNEFLSNKSIYKIIIPEEKRRDCCCKQPAFDLISGTCKACGGSIIHLGRKISTQELINSQTNCPTCGSEVEISGDTTHHYISKTHTNEEVFEIIKLVFQKQGVFLGDRAVRGYFEEFKK